MGLGVDIPPDVSLKDEYNWKITGGDAVETAGSTYSCDLVLSNIPTPGTSQLKFAWPLGEVTFTFELIPDDSGLQLTTWIAPPIYAVVLATWVSELSANFILNQAYVIDVFSGEIRLTARIKHATDYDLTVTPISLTGVSHNLLTSGVTEVLRELYKIDCEVLDENNVSRGTDLLDIDENGEAVFSPGEYVSAELTSSFTKEPDVGASMLNEDLEICKPFYIKYSEVYGSPPINKLVNRSVDKYAIGGGVSKWQDAIWHEAGYNFFNWIKDEKKFLTFRPRGAKTAFLSQERLYFLNVKNSIVRINMLASARFTDGSTFLDQFIGTANVTRDYSVFELICSPEKIRDKFTGVPTTKVFKSFSVKLLDDATSNLISEVFTFNIDQAYYNNNRFFFFENGLTAWDTIRTTGEVVKDADYAYELYSKFLNIDFSTRDHENARDRSVEVVSYEVDSGALPDRETANYYRELFLSGKAYEIIGGKLLPVRLASNKARIYRDNDYNYHISFIAQPTYNNKFYSNIEELKNAVGNYFGDGFGEGFFTAEKYIGNQQQNSNPFN